MPKEKRTQQLLNALGQNFLPKIIILDQRLVLTEFRSNNLRRLINVIENIDQCHCQQ